VTGQREAREDSPSTTSSRGSLPLIFIPVGNPPALPGGGQPDPATATTSPSAGSGAGGVGFDHGRVGSGPGTQLLRQIGST
jgi:hypothetical protein